MEQCEAGEDDDVEGPSSQPTVLIPAFGTASIRLQPFSVFHRPWPVTGPAANYVDSPMRGHFSPAAGDNREKKKKTTFSFSLQQWLKCKTHELLFSALMTLCHCCCSCIIVAKQAQGVSQPWGCFWSHTDSESQSFWEQVCRLQNNWHKVTPFSCHG